MLPEFVTTLTDLYEAYKKWVSENPQFVSDVETSIKWISYFIAGRMNSSPIISELIYSLSNLLVLFNDLIIERSLNKYFLSNEMKPRLKLMLTTLEYCEVFIELTAHQTWGENGRWFFISIVQVVKCICRLLLTLQYKEPIIQSPPIRPLNRKLTEEQIKNSDNQLGGAEHSASTILLKRSKKVLRKVEGSPPIHLRDWRAPDQYESLENDPNVIRHNGRTQITLAESIYIFKPLLHLTSISLFGYKSWKCYALALLLDAASLQLYHRKRNQLTVAQKSELAKRCVSLLLYIMRSPFYERISKNKISGLLAIISNTIPLTHMVCNPLLAYIPQWQKTYFYMWST